MTEIKLPRVLADVSVAHECGSEDFHRVRVVQTAHGFEVERWAGTDSMGSERWLWLDGNEVDLGELAAALLGVRGVPMAAERDSSVTLLGITRHGWEDVSASAMIQDMCRCEAAYVQATGQKPSRALMSHSLRMALMCTYFDRGGEGPSAYEAACAEFAWMRSAAWSDELATAGAGGGQRIVMTTEVDGVVMARGHVDFLPPSKRRAEGGGQ